MFKSHGCYIGDIPTALCVCSMPCGDAYELLRTGQMSGYVERNGDADLLLNKGYCVVAHTGDRALVVSNHDGCYSLWVAPWDAMRAKLPARKEPVQ